MIIRIIVGLQQTGYLSFNSLILSPLNELSKAYQIQSGYYSIYATGLKDSRKCIFIDQYHRYSTDGYLLITGACQTDKTIFFYNKSQLTLVAEDGRCMTASAPYQASRIVVIGCTDRNYAGLRYWNISSSGEGIIQVANNYAPSLSISDGCIREGCTLTLQAGSGKLWTFARENGWKS